MTYKRKAKLQNLISKMPRFVGDYFYYLVQRCFGALKDFNSHHYIENALRITRACEKAGVKINNMSLFELGTGRTVSTPLAMILQGAGMVTTVDANKYLKENLSIESARQTLRFFKEEKLKTTADSLNENLTRRCAKFEQGSQTLPNLLAVFNIKYLAPFDARKTALKAASVDLYFSTNVIEHITENQIHEIFLEAKRILKPNGLMVHYIDLRDHFAASDKTITNINFLKYSDLDWLKIAGNRFMYQNRLRLSDYQKLFARCDYVPTIIETEFDEKSYTHLCNGFKVDEKYKKYDKYDLATVGLTVVGYFKS